jgi:acyl-coenzyme A synthetase/AMP-(fatty) acid ligase
VFLDTMPTTATGKILRRDLRERFKDQPPEPGR